MTQRLYQLILGAARRPFLTLGIVGALAVIGAGLATGLEPNAGSDTFVSRSSPSYQATADDHQHFGGDAVVVLIKEPLPDLVETKDLATVSQLEACLAGETLVPDQTLGSFTPAPASATPYGGLNSPCGQLAKDKPVQVVYGPGTFLNRAVSAVNTQVRTMISSANQAVQRYCQAAYQLALARHLPRQQAVQACNAAAQIEQQQQTQNLERAYLNSGIAGTPRIDDPQFIPQIVFDQSRGMNQPKARFSYLFPTANSALIQARLKPGLSTAAQTRAISLIRQAVQMPNFRLKFAGTYTVSGVPVIVSDLSDKITSSIALLLVVALLVMGATLLLVFRRRLRLLPLLVALAAAGITFGALAVVGASLTLASLAVLPVLIGLAVDYAIQFQSRVQEARQADAAGGPASGYLAIARAAALAAPTIATAALATATGFLVLQLSPAPMVRGFGLLLIVGIAVALVCALTAGSAAMALEGRDDARANAARSASGLAGLRGAQVIQLLGASLRGAVEILRDLGAWMAAVDRRLLAPLSGAASGLRRTGIRAAAAGRRAVLAAARQPGRVLAVGAVLAVLGWVADTQTTVQSDVTKLVPSSMPALHDLHTLENVTGVSGEIDVTVRAANVATPKAIGWMVNYQNTLLTHYGYLETKGCQAATLCPALSLPDLFCSGAQTVQGGCAGLSDSSIQGLLSAVPPYFSQAVITPDRQEASLAFGIRLMPLARQQQVINYMRAQLHPPPGITASLSGLPVLAAQANGDLSSSARRLLTLLAGLAAVGVVLLAVFRQPRRALVPLIPIALATGWSALILWAIGIPLNPMSAALGTLVIAISTEFSVLLSERFRQERAAGADQINALARTYSSTGVAVLASGITAIAGFGVLVVSDITMLRDFGFVTLIDLSVSLAGVLLVLPAALALSERGNLFDSTREALARAGAARPRLRRRARVA
ncbi:MAG TPA: MMPL family transporter [Solirubrobacteraceae bacterium]|nr:MMPL family transporter [Solirubrobacteraceae bacterium]